MVKNSSENSFVNTAPNAAPSAGDSAEEAVDVVLIGLGPGGESAATQLAEAGLEVLALDRRLVGGECPYYGCTPSKLATRAAQTLAEARRVPDLAGEVGQVRPDFGIVAQRIREVTDDWDDTAAVETLTEAGARFARATGRIIAPHTVEYRGEDGVAHRVRARRGIVLNPGTEPLVPRVDGLDEVEVWTNREFLRTRELPRTLLVVGGGTIGSELAQAAARFGTEVTIVESSDRILGPEEPEASAAVATAFEREGITVRTGLQVTGLRRDGEATVAVLSTAGADAEDQSSGGKELTEELTVDRVLFSVGRSINAEQTGVTELGVELGESGAIPVDENCRVTDGVWALGDAVGHGQYTHTSIHQAQIVVADVLGRDHVTLTDRATPRVTFTDPPVGAVGLSVAQAREELGEDRVRVGRVETATTSLGWIHGEGNEGSIILIADAQRQVLVGASITGPGAEEVIGQLTLAVHAEVPLATLRSMIYAFPTVHRGILDALADLDGED